MELNKIYNEDCIEGMKRIPDGSVDCILTDPPYLYLKNQKLDRAFDEHAFFSECNRVLKKDGMMVMFGRGTSFYRWNTILADLKFKFKEEIVWNKSYCTSPLMPLSRVHETVSIHAKGKGKINKVKIPYLEMKGHDINSIIQDIKRLKTTFKNTKSLDAVLEYLENNERDTSDSWGANNLSISSDITKENRCVSVARSINSELNEKSIIRTDYRKKDTFTKHAATADAKSAGAGDKVVTVINSIGAGMNEKDIIRTDFNYIMANKQQLRGDACDGNRCVNILNSVAMGMNEKSIIRTDYQRTPKFAKHQVCTDSESAGRGNKCVDVANSIVSGMNEKSTIRTDFYNQFKVKNPTSMLGTRAKDTFKEVSAINAIYAGMNEKDIILETRDHYTAIHPTQKPVRLLERLLNLASKEGDTILDPFSGSGSTALACMNTSRNFIGFEIDKEYYEAGLKRIEAATPNIFSKAE